jgi:ribonucleoside-diphosphate reductase beta chain
MKNVYPDPTEVLDTIIETPEIMARAKTVTDAYDKFIEYANRYYLTGKGDMKELKRLLYLTLINVNILEGIRFYVSFACSFAFGELKLMEGSAKIISLIARDENLHLATSQNIINNYRNKENDKEMLKIIKENEEEVYKMYDEAVQQEKDWAKYLFDKGSMIGLNDKLLNQYVEYMANKRLRALGFDPLYDVGASQNPLPWTQHWLSSKGLQVAPQETEVESYLIGGIKQDVKKGQFSKFKL